MARQTVEMGVTKKSAGQIFNNFDPMFDSHIYRILEKPQGYNKFLVPPPVGGQQKVELKMSVEVTKILSEQSFSSEDTGLTHGCLTET